MAPGGTVDCADHRHLDVQEVHQQVAAFPMDPVDPLDRRARREGRSPWGRARSGKLRSGPGYDYDTVLAVGADVVKGLRQFAVRQKTPTERLAFGVQGDLQDAVAALHPCGLIFPGVFLQRAHFALPLLVRVFYRSAGLGARGSGGAIEDSPPAEEMF